MQGDEELRLRRIINTPQGDAIEGNAADDALMVDQGKMFYRTITKERIPKCVPIN
jgi:hypothetical protein